MARPRISSSGRAIAVKMHGMQRAPATAARRGTAARNCASPRKDVSVSVIVMPWKLTTSEIDQREQPDSSRTKIAGRDHQIFEIAVRERRAAPATSVGARQNHALVVIVPPNKREGRARRVRSARPSLPHVFG